MTYADVRPAASLNARVGAIALAVGGPFNLILPLVGGRLGPLAYLAWLVLSFGALCFCEEMGAGRPLNRAGAVCYAAAFGADTLALLTTDTATVARAHLLYAFAVLAALVVWSVALMHRANAAKAIGSVGAAVGGAALALLVAAHLLLGAATIIGFSQLFAALQEPSRASGGALIVINAAACTWALAVAGLLWRDQLRVGHS